MIDEDGTVLQGAALEDPSDTPRLTWPVLGIVLEVYAADDEEHNPQSATYGDGRSSTRYALVLVVNDGEEVPWLCPNVMITPRMYSGADDFEESPVRGCSMLLDGTPYRAGQYRVDTDLLDGDRVVVGFIGGSLHQPFVMGPWPHPGNTRDPATSGQNGTLDQEGRHCRRANGVTWTITPEGRIYFDTTEANARLKGSKSGVVREQRAGGGDLHGTMKDGSTLSLDWNPAVDDPTEPAVPQRNPPLGATSPHTRATAASRVEYTRDTLQAVAGQVARLMGRKGNNSVQLGGTPENQPTQHAAIAELVVVWATSVNKVLNGLVRAFDAHIAVPAAHGATVQPFVNEADDLSSGAVAKEVMVK